MMQPDIIGILILCICVFLFVTKKLPSSVVGCLGCIAMVLCNVATFEEAFSGFSSNIVLLMVSSMIVGIAMFKTGTAQFHPQTFRPGGAAKHNGTDHPSLSLCSESGQNADLYGKPDPGDPGL